jgi:hypothetical protein
MNKEKTTMMTQATIIGQVINDIEIKFDHVGAGMLCFMVRTTQLVKTNVVGQSESIEENHQIVHYCNRDDVNQIMLDKQKAFFKEDIVSIVGRIRSTPVMYAGTALINGGWIESTSIQVLQKLSELHQPKTTPEEPFGFFVHKDHSESPKGRQGIKKGLTPEKVRWAIKSYGTMSKAARALNVHPTSIRYWIRTYGA